MTSTNAIAFRPPWYFLVFWFLCGGLMLLFGIAVVGPLLRFPSWACWSFLALPSLALVVGLVLAFASVRVDRNGIACRHFRRWNARWEEVEAWSQLGPKGNVYMRTRDGRIHGFSSWCVYGARGDQLARLLKQRIGPELVGESAIVPRLRDILLEQ